LQNNDESLFRNKTSGTILRNRTVVSPFEFQGLKSENIVFSISI
jgi:hypothetical protein